jgi:sec-independent protein translocase protein TatB
MPNFTLSEILTIMLVILIVFGPQRLPEMARKAGGVVRKARTMATDLRREFQEEFSEVAEPLKEIRQELKGVQQDMGSSLGSLNEEVAKAKAELETQVAESAEEAQQVLQSPTPPAVDDPVSPESTEDPEETA